MSVIKSSTSLSVPSEPGWEVGVGNKRGWGKGVVMGRTRGGGENGWLWEEQEGVGVGGGYGRNKRKVRVWV